MITDKSPEENQNVIVYLTDGKYTFANYQKVLTWRGHKMKFVNLLSKGGFWCEDSDVEGWNPIPKREQSIL